MTTIRAYKEIVDALEEQIRSELKALGITEWGSFDHGQERALESLLGTIEDLKKRHYIE